MDSSDADTPPRRCAVSASPVNVSARPRHRNTNGHTPGPLLKHCATSCVSAFVPCCCFRHGTQTVSFTGSTLRACSWHVHVLPASCLQIKVSACTAVLFLPYVAHPGLVLCRLSGGARLMPTQSWRPPSPRTTRASPAWTSARSWSCCARCCCACGTLSSCRPTPWTVAHLSSQEQYMSCTGCVSVTCGFIIMQRPKLVLLCALLWESFELISPWMVTQPVSLEVHMECHSVYSTNELHALLLYLWCLFRATASARVTPVHKECTCQDGQ